MQRKEALTEEITLTLTGPQKQLLLNLSDKHGATMRGFIRKLIQDAARNELGEASTREGVRHDYARTA